MRTNSDDYLDGSDEVLDFDDRSRACDNQITHPSLMTEAVDASDNLPKRYYFEDDDLAPEMVNKSTVFQDVARIFSAVPA